MKLKCCMLIVMVPCICMSQSSPIDSLKKMLPKLRDSIRINQLNKISVEYYVNALSETYINVQTDSAIWFAAQAQNEAINLHYTKGIAEAIQHLGEIARDRNAFAVAENYFRESIPLFKKIHDLERYSWSHVTMGFCLYAQGKFSAAASAYESATPYYLSTNNNERLSMIFRLISLTYSARGFNEKAFENTVRALRLTDKGGDVRGAISSPENLASLYKNAGETATALTYFGLAAKKAKLTNPVRYNRLMAEMSLLNNNPDSAIFYYQTSQKQVSNSTTDSIIIHKSQCYISMSIAEVHSKQNKYDLAIEQATVPLQFFEHENDNNSLMRTLRLLANCYLAKQHFSKSLLYAKRLFAIAMQTGARPFLRDAYKLYWELYDHQKKTDSAYHYSLKYIAIKDSILSDEYRRNIALSQMKSQDEQQRAKISLLQKDQQLSKETLSRQQQKLTSESLIRYILFAITGAVVLIGIFLFRNVNLNRKNEKQRLEHELEMQHLESKKKLIEFQQQATELEMQALRAQMNPHFIFNCLSSINRFILVNKTEEASDYLTKFSRLIRMALHNSEKSMITLESELDALRLYLDLERLRFKNAFNYSISFINTIDINAVYIPPMLIQPFAENAIWHGLMHKKAIGCLEIKLSAANKILTCTIMDNGIGRDMAVKLNTRSVEKSKSMGVEITAGRLALLNKMKNVPAVLEIEDLTDDEGNGCGTRVTLSIPYKDLTQVLD